MIKLKENECRVYYKVKEKFLPFEKEVEKLFKDNGFERWASGYDLTNGIRDLCFENKVTARILRRAAKELYRKLKVEKPYYVEVENPKERRDFLRIIEKKDLVNYKLVIDNEGNTKQIYVKPTLLI